MCTDSTEGINRIGRSGLGRSQHYCRLEEGEVEPRRRWRSLPEVVLKGLKPLLPKTPYFHPASLTQVLSFTESSENSHGFGHPQSESASLLALLSQSFTLQDLAVLSSCPIQCLLHCWFLSLTFAWKSDSSLFALLPCRALPCFCCSLNPAAVLFNIIKPLEIPFLYKDTKWMCIVILVLGWQASSSWNFYGFVKAFTYLFI